MAHSRIAKDRMFEWIARCIEEGSAPPDDAAICEEFGFTSAESARTLLSDLADAGRITVKGWGGNRTIAIGRVRVASAPERAPRPHPSVRRADPDVDEAAARIMAIVRRGRTPSPDAAAAEAQAERVSPPGPDDGGTPERCGDDTARKDTDMAGKSIMLPAAAAGAIGAVEALAEEKGITFGQAAAQLIELGAAASTTVAAPAGDVAMPLALDSIHLDALLDEVRLRFERTARPDDLRAAIERAEQAELAAQLAQTKLAAARAAIG